MLLQRRYPQCDHHCLERFSTAQIFFSSHIHQSIATPKTTPSSINNYHPEPHTTMPTKTPGGLGASDKELKKQAQGTQHVTRHRIPILNLLKPFLHSSSIPILTYFQPTVPEPRTLQDTPTLASPPSTPLLPATLAPRTSACALAPTNPARRVFLVCQSMLRPRTRLRT